MMPDKIYWTFVEKKHLFVANTKFKHHKRRRYTWISPGDRSRNQIDYILVASRWKSVLTNSKTAPGADCDTDHQLLTATIQIRMKSHSRKTPCLRFDVSKDTTEYRVEVANRFETLYAIEEEREPDEMWEEMKTVMLETAREHFCLSNTKNVRKHGFQMKHWNWLTRGETANAWETKKDILH